MRNVKMLKISLPFGRMPINGQRLNREKVQIVTDCGVDGVLYVAEEAVRADVGRPVLLARSTAGSGRQPLRFGGHCGTNLADDLGAELGILQRMERRLRLLIVVLVMVVVSRTGRRRRLRLQPPGDGRYLRDVAEQVDQHGLQHGLGVNNTLLHLLPDGGLRFLQQNKVTASDLGFLKDEKRMF